MREFSRVDACIPLSARLVSEEEKNRIKSRISSDLTFISSRPFDEPVDNAQAEWLKIINQKIDFLINLITMQQQGFSSLPLTQVDISGGGINFYSEYPYKKGDILELKMVLETPSPIALYIYGEVVNCEPKDKGYRVGLKFINIDEDVRDNIVKFVFHRQRQILRQKREI
jgi:hypothetical protein